MVQELLRDSGPVLVRGSKDASRPNPSDCHWEITWLDRESGDHRCWPCHTIFNRHPDDRTKADISQWE
eukprot:scaffold657560_cov59-Prasinocladus_malaysianus.AAC.1